MHDHSQFPGFVSAFSMAYQLFRIFFFLPFFLALVGVHGRFTLDPWSIIDFVRPQSHDTEPSVFLWPMPAEVIHGNTTIIVDPSLELVPTGKGGNSVLILEAFQRYKRLIFSHHSEELGVASRQKLNIAGKVLLERLIVSVSSDDETLQFGTDETYNLNVPGAMDISEAYLEANSVYGVLRGLETFSQLCVFNFASKMVEISNAVWNITDAPRFKYRGLLIDTSRHYQPVDVIKQVIDSMAFAKLNVLHWHIVDEESFPLEIPSYPRLWNGAYTPSERYTIDDARDIVKYAKARGINVLAEIDVPGHAESWGYGYQKLWPSLHCREPLDVSQNFTFDVIESIIADLRSIFTFGLFHVGGDEVNTRCWTSTARIKKWLDDHQMTAKEGYEYFVLRAQKIVLSHGWTPINWEETFNSLADKLDPTTIVHNWLGPRVAPKVVEKGFRCIVSNQDVWYLDHLNVPWERFYMNEPLEGITIAAQQELVLGGEVCMWGETVDASDIQQTIWPRAAAAAERLWSPIGFTAKGADAATARLQYFRCLLNKRNIAAAPVANAYGRSAPKGPGSCYLQ